MKTKLIITDIDGVWTDGGMYLTENGDEIKKFNTADSFGILAARKFKILTCIITGEKTSIVEKRAKKLKVDYVFQGAKDKVTIASNLIKKLNISFDEVAFIGDDIGDYLLLQKAGISSCPYQSPSFIQNVVSFVTKENGGEGAFRSFVLKVLKINNITESEILESLNGNT